eukprot:312819-Prymnesium_polylepis.2
MHPRCQIARSAAVARTPSPPAIPVPCAAQAAGRAIADALPTCLCTPHAHAAHTLKHTLKHTPHSAHARSLCVARAQVSPLLGPNKLHLRGKDVVKTSGRSTAPSTSARCRPTCATSTGRPTRSTRTRATTAAPTRASGRASRRSMTLAPT